VDIKNQNIPNSC